jgi:periplasmic divalent cation tolerance protein
MEKFIKIFTTTEVKDDAEKIAEALVEQQLAACVQIIGPILSTYRWEGAVERGEEWLCSIKTAEALFGEVEKTIKTLHPYDVPELVALPIVNGSDEYLAWLGDQLRK